MDVGGLNGLGDVNLRRGVEAADRENEVRMIGGRGKAHLHAPVADAGRNMEDCAMGIHGEIRSGWIALQEETDETAV